MSISLTGGTLTAGNTNKEKEFNEFARIQGLGPAMQRWLRKSFHVQTVADLANLSVNRVLSQLEDEGKSFSRDQIERWITQARAFAAAQTSWQPFATFVISLQSRQIGGQTQQRTITYFVEADRRKIWAGIECNGVYELMLDQLKQTFQLQPEVNVPMPSESISESKLSDSESNLSEINPSEPEPVSEFKEIKHEPKVEPPKIKQPETEAESLAETESVPEPTTVELTQPELEPDASAKTESEADESLEAATDDLLEQKNEPEPEPEITEPLTLEITQLKFWQPLEAEKTETEEEEEPEPKKTKAKKAGTKKVEEEEPEPEKAIVADMARRSLHGMLKKEEPFQLEVTFQIAGTGATDLTREPISYHSQCFIQNRVTRERIQLESSSPRTLTEGELIYTSRLPEIALPQPGPYRFQIVTRLDRGYASPDLFELPFVQVV